MRMWCREKTKNRGSTNVMKRLFRDMGKRKQEDGLDRDN